MQRTRACNGSSGKSGVFIASVRPALGANTLAFDTVHLRAALELRGVRYAT